MICYYVCYLIVEIVVFIFCHFHGLVSRLDLDLSLLTLEEPQSVRCRYEAKLACCLRSANQHPIDHVLAWAASVWDLTRWMPDCLCSPSGMWSWISPYPTHQRACCSSAALSLI